MLVKLSFRIRSWSLQRPCNLQGVNMKITSVERNKKYKNMLSVYIDNAYAFSVSEEDYICLNLYEKKEITQEELDNIKNNLIFRKAKSSAIRYIASKLRSGKEVYTKLSQKGYAHDIIEKVVRELESMGYINDELYAQKYIYDRSKLKPKSKKMLRFELQSRGISDEIIERTLAEWKVDDSVLAGTLIKRKFGKYNLNDEKIVKRVYAFLQHRGFSFEIINDALNKLREL
jgi:regulatory protein